MSAQAGSPESSRRSRMVPAVLASMRIMDHLHVVGSARGNRITTALGLNASTCHEILKTLVHGGYLRYDATSREYSIGPAVASMSVKAFSSDVVIAAVRPALRRWVYETEFTAFMARWLPDRTILIVDKIESTREIKMTLEVGQRFPATAAALGKAFMAWMDPSELAAVLDSIKLLPHTGRSIRDRDAWMAELERVRALGWSESSREFYQSTNAVVAPVFAPTGAMEFAVGSLAAATELTDELLPQYGAKIRELAAEIQSDLFD